MVSQDETRRDCSDLFIDVAGIYTGLGGDHLTYDAKRKTETRKVVQKCEKSLMTFKDVRY